MSQLTIRRALVRGVSLALAWALLPGGEALGQGGYGGFGRGGFGGFGF